MSSVSPIRHRAAAAASVAALLLTAGCTGLASAARAPAPVAIRLIAINDFHGQLLPPDGVTVLPGGEAGTAVRVPLGGAAYLASAVAALKADHPRHVVVAAGDLISASPLESALFHDEPAIAALNAIGLDISSVGNHEFDDGRDALLRMQRGGCAPDGEIGIDTCVGGRYPGARFQYLAANVIDTASNAPLLPATAVRRFDLGAGRSLAIGFIGLTLKGTPELVSRPGIAGLRFDDEAETINRQAAILQTAGVEAIVVLIHEGGAVEPALAYNDPACPGFSGDIEAIVAALDPAIDVVISGHTHRAYNCRRASRDPAKTVLLTSAGNAGRFVSALDLDLDPATGEVIASRADIQPVINDRPGNEAPAQYPPRGAEPGVAALVAEFRDRALPLTSRPVGRIAAALGRDRNEAGEMPLGLVIADAQLDYAARSAEARAVIAFMNPGGVRADLKPLDDAGTVSYGQVYSVQPFGGDLMTMSLTGAQIDALLEQQWRSKGQSSVLQPSRGFAYRWDAGKPVGERVDPASITLDGVVLDPAQRYRINVNGFLASGGDGFTVLIAGTERQAFGLDRDALIEYLGRRAPVAAPTVPRIERR